MTDVLVIGGGIIGRAVAAVCASRVKSLLVRRDAVVGILADDGLRHAGTEVVAAGVESATLCASASVRLAFARDEGALVVAKHENWQDEAPRLEGDAWVALDQAGRVVVAEPDRLAELGEAPAIASQIAARIADG